MSHAVLADATVRRTLILHVVAIAGLAAGALTGAWMAREASRLDDALRSQGHHDVVLPDALDADGDHGAACMLPGVRKPGDPGCNA